MGADLTGQATGLAQEGEKQGGDQRAKQKLGVGAFQLLLLFKSKQRPTSSRPLERNCGHW